MESEVRTMSDPELPEQEFPDEFDTWDLPMDMEAQ